MQINKKENMNVLCLQAFGLTPKMGRPRSSTRSSIAVAREEKSDPTVRSLVKRCQESLVSRLVRISIRVTR